MKIKCENGFYKFFPQNAMELKAFESRYNFKLKYCRGFWTFPSLADFPDYSFAGHILTGIIPAIINFSGTPEEVFKKNNLTYNLKLEIIMPKASILTYLDYDLGNYNSSKELPQAFGFDKDGDKITGFEAFVDVGLGLFKIERFFYEGI